MILFDGRQAWFFPEGVRKIFVAKSGVPTKPGFCIYVLEEGNLKASVLVGGMTEECALRNLRLIVARYARGEALCDFSENEKGGQDIASDLDLG